MKRERVEKAKELLLLLRHECLDDQMSYADMYDHNETAKNMIDELAVESNMYYELIKEIDIVLGIREPDMDKDMLAAYKKYDGGDDEVGYIPATPQETKLILNPDGGNAFMGTTAPQHKLEVKPNQTK